MATARAAVQVADRRYEIQEFPLPRIGPDEALLRVDACGMCGSDVEQYDGGFAALGVAYPLIPGHEPVGTIAEIGAEAARRWRVRVGDRVAVEPVLGCGSCRACLTGNYRRCVSSRHGAAINAYGYLPTSAGPGLWGGYAEYLYLDPRTVLHKLDPDLPLELAALYQPMAAGLRWFAFDSGLRAGDTVVVLGCGQRGLAGVVAAREAGAGRIIVTGLARDAHKLELARRLGADVTVVADTEDTVAAVAEATGGEGADVVVDVTAVATQPIVDAVEIAKPGATVVLAGVKGSGATVSGLAPDRIVTKELTVKGLWSQDIRAFEPALRLIESRRYPLELLHTHTFGLEQVPLAVETLAGRVPGEDAVHVMIAPGA
ncbi:zinc-dependent alcohol dehydrogenase [Amycolatopsis viridis]|uniref:Threonine dehydrogenase-like Zn-dependent dehydrogenase n=1 Tax=Amycolatopsis viridis TaxID=185678 RepID=A0ABX0SZJ0_9PSEU|nr:alcohol dehydrogenase catalytic domain-containing protein [Amycolatopsis viridis]NIH80721.1 threonine dehydrogenase-like Zn-dependent dehydrogenase [Amycolatopsis viridis]